MMRTAVLTAALVLGALSGVPAFAGDGITQGCSFPTDGNARLGSLYDLIADLRQKRALSPVLPSEPLTAAAQSYACSLAASNLFQHVGPDGSGPMTRAGRMGCGPQIVAENLALGQQKPEAIVADWMGSPGHRRNLISPRIRAIGLGVAETARGPLWVLMVADGC